MIVNAGNIQKLMTGFRTTFSQAFEGAKTTADRIAMRVTSGDAAETYAWLGQFPKLREWLGDRVIQNLELHDFSIKNKDFELTIGVDRNSIQDDKYGVYTPLFAEMGRSAKVHPDELLYALLVLGFTTPCYDGQYFFDTDHPGAGGASVSNYQAGALAPWFLLDVSRAIKPLIFQEREAFVFKSMDSPTDEEVFMRKKFRFGVDGRDNAGFALWQLAHGSKAALTADNYGLVRAAMAGRTGESGQPLGISGNLLVVGSSNEKAAREILVAERNAAGASNIWQNSAELLVSPYLT